MINVKQELGTILTAPTITALVPATSITSAWPDFDKPLPAIAYREIDNFTTTDEYFDNLPIADRASVSIDIFTAPGKSSTPIFQAVNAAMEAAGWNRDAAEDLLEPESKILHKVLRYSNVLYR